MGSIKKFFSWLLFFTVLYAMAIFLEFSINSCVAAVLSAHRDQKHKLCTFILQLRYVLGTWTLEGSGLIHKAMIVFVQYELDVF